MTAFRARVISKEAILPQTGDKFGYRLEALVTEIREKIHDGATFSSEVKEIESALFDRLGIKVKLITNERLAAANVPVHTSLHPLINYKFKNTWLLDFLGIRLNNAKIVKALAGKVGTVDLEKAKVGGVFSEINNNLYMNFNSLFMDFKLSPAEVVAVMLHECGHIYTFFEFMNRMESSNTVLEEMQAISLKGQQIRYDIVFKKINPNGKISKEDLDRLSNGKGITGTVEWMKAILGNDDHIVRSQMNSKYDNTSAERLADDFATKFGYGRQVVTALERLVHVMYPADISGNTYLVLYTVRVVLVVQFVAMIFAPALPAVGALAIAFSFILLKLFGSGESGKEYTYDDMLNRYRRIRNSIYATLKDTSMEDVDIVAALQSIEMIDSIMDKTSDDSHIFDLIVDFMSPKSREIKNSVVRQQLLEDLGDNPLFARAASLRTI